MFVAHAQRDMEVADEPALAGRAAGLRPMRADRVAEPPVASRYESRSNWPLALLIAALHAALLIALIKLDVVHIAARRPDRVLIEIKPMEMAPPPRAPRLPEPPPRLDTPIAAPPPVIATVLPPPPIAASPVADPTPPDPAPAAAPAPPAPIVPPDASAATLGNTPPRYPVESRRQREEGTVRLRVLISPEGKVDEISLAKSSGFDRLDKAALDAVRRWRFRPGTQAGKPVQAVGYLSIPFALTR